MNQQRPPTTLLSTLRIADTPRTSEPSAGPALFLAFDGDRPASLPARWRLNAVTTVNITRASRLGSVPGNGTLTIRLADAFASSSHARLRRDEGGRWTIEDLGSKNGTFVNGFAVTKHVLEDGAVIQIGRSVLIFRDSRTWALDDVITAGSDELTHPYPTLRTMVPELHRQFASLAQLALSSANIVIHGETGTGKEVVAKAIHALSARPGAFVGVNCGAIPDDLIESELFGHARGAFTGALDRRLGLVRAAQTGTLFLDEIGDLPLHVQTALLRVLQEREVTPVGADRAVTVDIRVVSATHRDLEQLITEGRFRDDLYARLGSLRVDLPPLRERLEDLGILIAAALRGTGLRDSVRVDSDAAGVLFRYSWPRNIRELQQHIEAAALIASDGLIRVEDLPHRLREVGAVNGAKKPRPKISAADLESPIRTELIHQLTLHGGNITAVARAMQKDPKQVRRWLERYGLDPRDYRR